MLAAPGPGRHSGRLAYVAADHFGRGIRMNLRAKKMATDESALFGIDWRLLWWSGRFMPLSIPDVDSGKELCPNDPISLPISFSLSLPLCQVSQWANLLASRVLDGRLP